VPVHFVQKVARHGIWIWHDDQSCAAAALPEKVDIESQTRPQVTTE